MVKSDSEYMVEHLKQMCLNHVKANKKLRDENIQIQTIMNKFMQKSARLEDEKNKMISLLDEMLYSGFIPFEYEGKIKEILENEKN